MIKDVQQLVKTRQFPVECVDSKTGEIYDTVLRESAHLDGGNFTQLHPDDVERLFDLYDQLFFESGMAPRLEEFGVIFPTYKGAAKVAVPVYKSVPNPVARAVRTP